MRRYAHRPVRDVSVLAVIVGLIALPLPAAAAPSPFAAVRYGWGKPVSGDEFNYVGRPEPKKWYIYSSPPNNGNGVRSPRAWHVNGKVVTVSGDANGTTGGMAARFGHRKYGRWEARMRTTAREPQYHPVLLLWPDSDSGPFAEVDYAESTRNTQLIKFFLHFGDSQTSAARKLDTRRWHNYAVEWTPEHVFGYIDGVPWFRDTDTSHVPQISMHQTVQLDWWPNGSKTKPKPSSMSVDWIRVYKP